MSAKGQKRTSTVSLRTSALGQKRTSTRDARECPLRATSGHRAARCQCLLRARIQEPRWHRRPHDAVAHAFTATQHVPRRLDDRFQGAFIPVEACQRSWRDSGVRGFTHHAMDGTWSEHEAIIPVCWREQCVARRCSKVTRTWRAHMPILLWLIGVPLSVIVLLMLFGVLHI